MAPQNEYTTFESHGGLEVDKPSSSLNLKAKVLALGFLLATIGAFVGLSGGVSSAETSLADYESVNIRNVASTVCDASNPSCCDDENGLYGPSGGGTCAILRSKMPNTIYKICQRPSAGETFKTAQDFCFATCDACAQICECEDGTPATGDACVISGDNTCAACDTGYFLTSNGDCQEHTECEIPGEHETQVPTGTQDRVCAGNVCNCPDGSAAQGSACTGHGLEFCISCSGEFHLAGDSCEPWTVCGAGEHETNTPHNDEDRECADNTCVCLNGNEAGEGTAACETDNANICTSCSGDFFLNGLLECQAWTACEAGTMQSQAPSNTQDRVCQGAVCGDDGSCCDDDDATYGPEGAGNCATLRELTQNWQIKRVCENVDDEYDTANDHCLHTCNSCPDNCGVDKVRNGVAFCNRVDSCTFTSGGRACSDGNRGKCASCVDCDQSQCEESSGCTMAWVDGECSP